MNSIRLTDLPEEVIQNVLFRLDYATALAVEATCRRFRDVANEPLLWKSFCQDGWKKWHPRHQFKAKVAGSGFTGWKALFAERTRSSRETRVLVEGIVGQDLDRIPKVERIVELGWDAKDALLDAFRNAHLNESNVLAQRWVARPAFLCGEKHVLVDGESGIGARKCLAAYIEQWPLTCGPSSTTRMPTSNRSSGHLVLLISSSSLRPDLAISRMYVVLPVKRKNC